MPVNLELKAKCRSLSRAKRICREIGARRAGLLRQRDTYYDVRSGRLKLREINGKSFELIYYLRGNEKGSRYSKYYVLPLRERRVVNRLLESACGVRAVVRKKRELYLFENSRIHLDVVDGLGSFIEFEVLVTKGKRQAQVLMAFLRKRFDIDLSDVFAGSYSDLRGQGQGRWYKS